MSEKNPSKEKLAVLHTYIKPSTLERLTQWSKRMNVSKSYLIRVALEEFVVKYYHKMEDG